MREAPGKVFGSSFRKELLSCPEWWDAKGHPTLRNIVGG
jgi:hypothetical protein